MTKRVDSILEEVSQKIDPSKNELEIINDSLGKFVKKIEKELKKSKIDAEVFIGGSFAKGTLIKKNNYDPQNQKFSVSQDSNKIQEPYDIDIFIRFNRKYRNENISKMTQRILKSENFSVIHGSRDYFRIKVNPSLFFEIIPVIKIETPKEAENVTDLSYFHVRYIRKKIKSKKILRDIKLVKVFCYANDCYGAESYIGGFSGYALELLIYHYGSFLRFIKAITKIEDRAVIDIEKHYKNRQAILMDVNSSKLQSPIILIDPTYKQRNISAALSPETFEKFKKTCKKFLKNLSIKFFESKPWDLKKIEKDSSKKGYSFILLEAKTNRQEGDVAGSKLSKFYKHLRDEINKFFEIKNKGFDYKKGKSAKYFFVVKRKKEILASGPGINDKKNLRAFKKKHKKTFVKNKRIYSKEKIGFDIKRFVDNWKVKNKRRIREMSIIELKII